MSPLKRIVWPVAGLFSAVCAGAVYGGIVIYLAFGLIAVLALTGTFASPRRQRAAQVVLAILLGRTLPREVSSLGVAVHEEVAAGAEQHRRPEAEDAEALPRGEHVAGLLAGLGD
jgi:hypothetical protein